jgi:hypothetical protein
MSVALTAIGVADGGNTKKVKPGGSACKTAPIRNPVYPLPCWHSSVLEPTVVQATKVPHCPLRGNPGSRSGKPKAGPRALPRHRAKVTCRASMSPGLLLAKTAVVTPQSCIEPKQDAVPAQPRFGRPSKGDRPASGATQEQAVIPPAVLAAFVLAGALTSIFGSTLDQCSLTKSKRVLWRTLVGRC